MISSYIIFMKVRHLEIVCCIISHIFLYPRRPTITYRKHSKFYQDMSANGSNETTLLLPDTQAPLQLEDHPIENFRPLKIIVIGAGYSGIYQGIRIPERIRNFELVIYEKNAGPGGAWWENRYPGCACDVPGEFREYSTIRLHPFFREAYLIQRTYINIHSIQIPLGRNSTHRPKRYATICMIRRRNSLQIGSSNVTTTCLNASGTMPRANGKFDWIRLVSLLLTIRVGKSSLRTRSREKSLRMKQTY